MSEVDDLRDRVEELESRVSEIEKQVSDSVQLDKKISLVEFVKNSSSASTHKERIATIGYYLEAQESQETFTTADIDGAYGQLGEKISNAAARASDAVSEGWIQVEDAGPPREFTVTKTGGEIVEGLLE